MLKGRKVNPKVRTLVVPGSQDIKRQAEAEGLDKVFKEAGAEYDIWVDKIELFGCGG